jgi:hypothetical protein
MSTPEEVPGFYAVRSGLTGRHLSLLFESYETAVHPFKVSEQEEIPPECSSLSSSPQNSKHSSDYGSNQHI